MSPPMPDRFRREDESDDALFYAQLRFVTHIDDHAINAVSRLYRERLPAGGDILDFMTSWVSHLPDDVQYRRVVGLGMNRYELDANPRLHRRVVHDLNREPRFPFEDAEFDAAACCVSIDYLARPVVVLADLARVCRPDATLVITFSNRCFPTKAIAPWLLTDDQGHLDLVAAMLEATDRWDRVEQLDRSPHPGRSDPLFAVIARRRPYRGA